MKRGNEIAMWWHLVGHWCKTTAMAQELTASRQFPLFIRELTENQKVLFGVGFRASVHAGWSALRQTDGAKVDGLRPIF